MLPRIIRASALIVGGSYGAIAAASSPPAKSMTNMRQECVKLFISRIYYLNNSYSDTKSQLNEDNLPSDPMELFSIWLDEAIRHNSSS